MESSNEDKLSPREKILEDLKGKTQIKQLVYDNTFEVFKALKDILHELVGDINEELGDTDKRAKLEYRDRGQYEAEIRVAGDILVFSMHTNVFEFDHSHMVWKTSYVQQDPNCAFSGMINIYNFLTDSFKYNRMEDLGYLIARLFINKDNNYFLEGQQKIAKGCHDFGNDKITRKNIINIVEKAIQFSLDFEMYVPPYDAVKIVSVGQINNKIDDAKIQTGKRLGFQFNSDDVMMKDKK